MSVIIQQGKNRIVAMNGVVVGLSDEKNAKIVDDQRQIFKNDFQIEELIGEEIDLDQMDLDEMEKELQ